MYRQYACLFIPGAAIGSRFDSHQATGGLVGTGGCDNQDRTDCGGLG